MDNIDHGNDHTAVFGAHIRMVHFQSAAQRILP